MRTDDCTLQNERQAQSHRCAAIFLSRDLPAEANGYWAAANQIMQAGRCLMAITKPGQPPPSNDPLTRARCRALARVFVAYELNLEPECVRSRSDGHPYLVLKVPESLPVEKRVQDWLTVYCGGVEAEKQVYGSYTGDGSGEIEDLGHEFHFGEETVTHRQYCEYITTPGLCPFWSYSSPRSRHPS